MKQAITSLLFFFFVLIKADAQDPLAVPASSFLDEVPKGNLITTASEQHIAWLFNNTGIKLNSETNLMTHVTIAEEGTYHLFVRSSGDNNSSFKVAVNDKVTDSIFGNALWSWKKGGALHLRKGMNYVKITRINPGDLNNDGIDEVLVGSLLLDAKGTELWNR